MHSRSFLKFEKSKSNLREEKRLNLHLQEHTRKLQSSTSSTTLPPGGITWDWRAVFNSADFHAGSSEGSDGSLTAWTWGLLLGTTSRSDLDVESGDAELLASGSHVLSGLHSSVRRVLVSIGLDPHTTGNSGDGLLSREIGDMNEGILVRSVKVANTEDVLAISDLWAELDDLLLFDDLLLWCHF